MSKKNKKLVISDCEDCCYLDDDGCMMLVELNEDFSFPEKCPLQDTAEKTIREILWEEIPIANLPPIDYEDLDKPVSGWED